MALRGNGRGQINGPIGITVLDGKIYVSSYKNNRVDVFNPDGKYVSSLPEDDNACSGSFGLPVGLSISNGTYAVADSARSKILFFNENGFSSGIWKKGDRDKRTLHPRDLISIKMEIFTLQTAEIIVSKFSLKWKIPEHNRLILAEMAN
ncbi:MAG: hypothetical protein R2883_07200 [Caldisericia bacterium]